MSIYILTSMFPDGLPAEASKVFQQTITRRTMFAFGASDFEQPYEKTDYYFKVFLDMLADSGILFENACVVDGRSTPAEAQRAVEEADVVWLSGGDTPLQFHYLQNYGLDRVIGHQCDDSIIVCRDKNAAFYGEIYEIKNGKVQRIKEKQRECI